MSKSYRVPVLQKHFQCLPTVVFLAALDLHCCTNYTSLVVVSGGYSLVVVQGLLIVVAFLVAEYEL